MTISRYVNDSQYEVSVTSCTRVAAVCCDIIHRVKFGGCVAWTDIVY